MTDTNIDAKAQWNALNAAYEDYIAKRMKLFAAFRNQVPELVRAGLGQPSERALAFDVLECLSDEEKQELLRLILGFCSSAYAGRAKSFILGLPREWVLKNIEAMSEPVLANNGFLDWCNVLDVYARIDASLAQGLAHRMTQHADRDIRDWGTEYLGGVGG